ncbi:MAG TPA: isochorismate synthase, partial [Solirubrobacteraceae bacterium]|nr:isochorismate synthase [Solirubrobacteraceae bacterium]
MSGTTASGGRLALAAADRERLRARLAEAVRRARRGRAGRALAAVTVRVPADVDPTATVVASRARGEPWFAFEQPDRDRTALATLGCATALEAAGPERFRAVARAWRALVAGGAYDDPDGPRGAGPVAVGGFAFDGEGGNAPHWSGFAPASLHVPELALHRRGEEVRLTLAAVAAPDDHPDELFERLAVRAAGLREAPLPLLDPDPAHRVRVVSAMPPRHYEEAVARAVERIRAGALAKVVLAREVQVHAHAPHDAAAVLG